MQHRQRTPAVRVRRATFRRASRTASARNYPSITTARMHKLHDVTRAWGVPQHNTHTTLLRHRGACCADRCQAAGKLLVLPCRRRRQSAVVPVTNMSLLCRCHAAVMLMPCCCYIAARSLLNQVATRFAASPGVQHKTCFEFAHVPKTYLVQEQALAANVRAKRQTPWAGYWRPCLSIYF